jgi:hypothetical protein
MAPGAAAGHVARIEGLAVERLAALDPGARHRGLAEPRPRVLELAIDGSRRRIVVLIGA